MSEDSQAPAPRVPGSRVPGPVRRRALWLVLALAATAGLLELGLRTLIFVAPVEGLRDPALYSPRWSDARHALAWTFSDPELRRDVLRHPRLGWTHSRFDPVTWAHEQEGLLRGRRPVLLFGDSFAACVTARRDCWGGLLERSDLSDRYRLLNYGVPAYGLDQTYLLMKEVLPRWLERDPIVVVSLLLDADLDRAGLTFFQWPKPRFTVDDHGALVPGDDVPASEQEWLDGHGLGVTSFVWSWLGLATGLTDREASTEHRERVARLTPPLLEALKAELEGAGLDYVVLVFHGMKHLREPGYGAEWEPLLMGELQRLGIPYESSKPDLLAADGTLEELFVLQGPARRHYTPAGNSVVFAALRRAIERFGGR
jgi:hypothetical protein